MVESMNEPKYQCKRKLPKSCNHHEKSVSVSLSPLIWVIYEADSSITLPDRQPITDIYKKPTLIQSGHSLPIKDKHINIEWNS